MLYLLQEIQFNASRQKVWVQEHIQTTGKTLQERLTKYLTLPVIVKQMIGNYGRLNGSLSWPTLSLLIVLETVYQEWGHLNVTSEHQSLDTAVQQ